MKLIILSVVLLALGYITNGQSIYDSTDQYYSKTDFSFKDNLDVWRYKVHMYNRNSDQIGYIILWRAEPWDFSNAEFHSAWSPNIRFDVFRLIDSLSVFSDVDSIRKSSTCRPPEVGGDRFIIGDFIFANYQFCLTCVGLGNKDYCRPTIKRIFENIDRTKISSLKDILNQLPIKRK